MAAWQWGLADLGSSSLYLGNHDHPRAAFRFGDVGAYRVASANTLATGLSQPAISAPRTPGKCIVLVMEQNRRAIRRFVPGSPFNDLTPLPPVETYAIQDLVTHDRYGLGTVLGVEGEVAVLVDFGPQQVRITVPCSKLIKL